MHVQNKLAEFRKQRGISAAVLASKVGVKRQTIYAIEAERYAPNTLVALRLSQVLGVPVEELFAVGEQDSDSESAMPADFLADAAAFSKPEQPIRLCKVGNRRIAVPSSPVLGELPAADAVVVGPGKGGAVLVRPFKREEDQQNRLLIAGCDPAMPVLARHLLKHGNVELITRGCSSLRALEWLKERKIHIGGTHLRSESPDGSNLEVIKKFFPRGGFRVVTFARWEEGLVVATGNPSGISKISDLARRNLKLVNREIGAGSRYLLDSLLKKEGISPKDIAGYDQIVDGHIMAAWHIHSGKADCCVATQASARVFGLDFVPLVSESFDLVIPQQYWHMPAVQILLDALNRSSLKRELEILGGYDTSQTGRLAN